MSNTNKTVTHPIEDIEGELEIDFTTFEKWVKEKSVHATFAVDAWGSKFVSITPEQLEKARMLAFRHARKVAADREEEAAKPKSDLITIGWDGINEKRARAAIAKATSPRSPFFGARCEARGIVIDSKRWPALEAFLEIPDAHVAFEEDPATPEEAMCDSR